MCDILAVPCQDEELSIETKLNVSDLLVKEQEFYKSDEQDHRMSQSSEVAILIRNCPTVWVVTLKIDQ